MTSAVAEWLVALAFLLFILTFVEDFRNFGIETSRQKHNEEKTIERKASAWDQV